MGEKRVIEQIASDEIYNDDWFLKDSVLHDTTKVQPSVIKEYMNQGMATSQDLADEVTARQNMDNQLASGISKQMSNLADFYDTTKSYVVGDVCVLPNGELKRCIAPTSGAFDITKWESVTVDELFDDLNFSADAISYDNTSSGLEAENVQDAIDETITKLSAVGSASGDIATFTDGSDLPMPKLEVAIEPVQDLHGYDSPWVGGSGKNKLKVTGKSSTDHGITFNVNQDGTIVVSGTFEKQTNFFINLSCYLKAGNYILNGVPSAPSWSTFQLYIVANGNKYASVNGTQFTIDEDGEYPVYISIYGELSGTLIFKPMIRLASVTDATFEPYSNICPISGWTEANVTRCGKNLFDKTKATVGKFITSQGVEATHNQMAHSDYIKVKSNTTYYTNADATGMFYIIALYDKNKNFMNAITVASPTSFNTSTASYVIINTASAKTSIDDMYVIEGSEATDYEPYTGHTYTIDLDGTRYGGKVDLVSGVMTVDRAMVNLGTLNWSYTSSSGRNLFTSNDITDYKHTGSNDIPVNAISECFKIVSMSTIFKNGQMGMDGVEERNRIIICDNRYTDATSFKTAMSGVQLVYELATPLTIQLPPTVVKSLRGVNNVFADCGAILDAEYIRDLTTIIDYILEQLNA